MREKQQDAVRAALDGKWELAIELNLEILTENAEDLAAMNRLARAYTEIGQKDAARDAYNRVLKIDKYNTIAIKNLKALPHQGSTNHVESSVTNEDFIEEPGITKTTALIKVASRDILLTLGIRQKLNLTPRAKLMAVTTENNLYIGCLPDDLSLRLRSSLKSGYGYTTCIKGTTESSVYVFLREVKRPNRPLAGPTFSRTLVISPKK